MDHAVGHPGEPEEFLWHRLSGGKRHLLMTGCPKKSTSLTFCPASCSLCANCPLKSAPIIEALSHDVRTPKTGKSN